MRKQKAVSILVLIIAVLSVATTLVAILSDQGPGEYQYQTIFKETVAIYGKGLYQHDSVAMASQAIAQDFVTLFLGVPLLLLSLFLARKDSLKGKLLLTGTLGYFLYTYASYSFLSMYNTLFLIYVVLMSASFFAFMLMTMSFNIQGLPRAFSDKLPVKFIGGFLLFTSILFGIMWLGKIIPPLFDQVPPEGLEHYTTLVIQALDLGFVVPAGVMAGIFIIRKQPFGYLLAPILIIKEITLLTAMSAMVILQIINGIIVSPVVLILVLALNIIVIYIMFLIMKNVNR
jgi:hypothetical protein